MTEATDTPSVEGLEVRLLPGSIPAVYVRNDTPQELAVPGRDGEPFLRIGPEGVFGNTRSPSYYLGGNQTIRSVPKSADASAPPRWQRLSEQPFWAWLEYRALLPTSAEHRSNLGDERRTILEWTTPMVLGDQELGLGGKVDWIPRASRRRQPNNRLSRGPPDGSSMSGARWWWGWSSRGADARSRLALSVS